MAHLLPHFLQGSTNLWGSKNRIISAPTLDVVSSEFESLLQPGRVVMHLMWHYLDSNHQVYTDKYYTRSIPLTQSQLLTTPPSLALSWKIASISQTWLEKNHSHSSRMITYPWALLDAARRAKGKDKTLIMLSSSSSAKMVEVPAMHNTQQMLKPESVNECMN